MSEMIGWHDCHSIDDSWLSSVVVNTVKALTHRVFAAKVLRLVAKKNMSTVV